MKAPKRILHLDVATVTQPVTVLTTETELYIVYWWHGIPLGHVEMSTENFPKNVNSQAKLAFDTIVANLRAHLCEYDIKPPELNLSLDDHSIHQVLATWDASLIELKQRWRASPTQQSVSLVICTRDRAEHLKNCLQSLQELNQQPDEIIVVDNAPSSDSTRQLVTPLDHVRYILEPRPGLDIARNTGFQNSQSELVAYIDDDVTVNPDWIAGLRRGFNHPTVMAVTGLVLASELDSPSQIIFERYWSFNRGYQPVVYDKEFFQKFKRYGVPAWQIGAGANMAFRRSVFDHIGGFDKRLDVGAAGCSGDSEYWHRVLAHNWICRYEPTAVAYHCHRRTMDGLKHQLFYYMRGHVAALLVRYERSRYLGNLIHIGLLVPYYIKLIIFGWLQGRERYSTLLQEIGGCISGVIFYYRNRKIGAKTQD